MSTIPVVDLTGARAGDLDEAAAAVGEAVRSVGFFQIVGHGVPAECIDAVYREWAEFLATPLAEKKELRDPNRHPFRGWNQYRHDHGAVVMERIQVCSIGSAEEAIDLGIDSEYADYFKPNHWPGGGGFQHACAALFLETRLVAATLMSLFAVGLDLPADYFAPMLARDVSCFAINHYPGELSTTEVEEFFPQHSDSGTLTLLHQRGSYEGLQVLLLDGRRITVPLMDEAFVVNVGQLMSRWTNDQFVATPHRVVPAASPGRARTSLTTFHLPAIDTVIAPLPSCVGAEGPHYEAVTPYEWESRYLAAEYGKQAR